MTAWRVTHIDAGQQRHVLHVVASGWQQAEARAEALHGPALFLACIRTSA